MGTVEKVDLLAPQGHLSSELGELWQVGYSIEESSPGLCRDWFGSVDVRDVGIDDILDRPIGPESALV
jgi:hypothetical protein